MMTKTISPLRTACRLGIAALLVSLAGAGQAGVLAGQDPHTPQLNGVQADAQTASYSQVFNAAAGQLDTVTFWGYRLNEAPPGGYNDNFRLRLNGNELTGTWAQSVSDGLLTLYMLDIPDQALAAGAGTLEVLSDSFDFEWYWQGSTATPYNPLAPFPVAFRLDGQLAPLVVPEPGSLALIVAAAAGLLATRRRAAA